MSKAPAATGPGLTRHVLSRQVAVVEIDRPNRQRRRRTGKSDPHDAVAAALADAVNEPHAWRTTDTELLTVYAEAVSALARLQRAQLAGRTGTEVPLAIIDHLFERLRQTRAGEIEIPLADVVDRLHAEAIREPVTV